MRFIYMIDVTLLQDKLQCSVRKPTKACIITKESVENVYVYTAQAIFGHYRSDCSAIIRADYKAIAKTGTLSTPKLGRPLKKYRQIIDLLHDGYIQN